MTSQVRSYNRIGVFVAFFCLFAALWALDHYLVSRRWPVPLRYVIYPLIPLLWLLMILLRKFGPTGRDRADRLHQYLSTRTVPGTLLVWGGVFVIGFLDQTPYAWFKSGITKTINTHAGRFLADEAFFTEIEASMPPGSKVFCLPYAPFPEHNPIAKMPVYEHARGYIHTRTLIWSYGAMKGREADAWQLDVAAPPMIEPFAKLPRVVVDFVDRIVCAGFDGLLIDTRGFTSTKEGDRARAIMKIIADRYEVFVHARKKRPVQESERLNVIHHMDGRQFFVDLRPYREELRQGRPDYYEEMTRKEQEWVALLWLDGFESPEEPVYHDILRFAPREASAWFVNPSNRERKFGLWMTFGTDTQGPFQMRLSGLLNDDFVLDRPPTDWTGPTPARHGETRYYEVTVPPGRHAIRFHCTPPPHFVPADNRRFCFFIMLFRREEIR